MLNRHSMVSQHSILLLTAIGAIPDRWCRILHVWDPNLYVQTKWNRKQSNPINIEKGTHQDGLTSPYIV